MRTVLIVSLLIFSLVNSFAQKTDQKLYEKFLTQKDAKGYKDALETLEKIITKYPGSQNLAQIYFEKAWVNIELQNEDAALADYSMAYKYDSTFAEAIRLRGNLKHKRHDDAEALKDYDLALRIDPQFARAYACKAYVYKNQSNKEEACKNFELALSCGLTGVVKDLIALCDTNSLTLQKFYFKNLSRAEDPEYGLTGKKPIKVGLNIKRQRLFLSLLRDSKGNPVKYTRTSSCCAYASENGFMGMALCDTYTVEIDGEIKTLYITFYDYEEPKIPAGFFIQSDPQK